MSTINCGCGESFSDAEIPSPHLYHVIPDLALGDVVRRMIELARGAGDTTAIFSELEDASTAVYKCPHCGRLLVYDESEQRATKVYAREV